MKKYFKKSLSLFMAALMLMSCWVFFAPKAEAVTAGKYYYKLWAVVSDGGDGQYFKWSIRGKKNNGTASQTEFVTQQGCILKNDNTTYTIKEGTADEFPTQIYGDYYNEVVWPGSRSMKATVHLAVGPNSSSLTEVSLSASCTSSGGSGSASASGNTIQFDCRKKHVYYTINVASGSYPKADTVVMTKPGDVTVPKTGNATTSFTSYVKDQYGVIIGSSATGYSRSVSLTSNRSSTTGISAAYGLTTANNDPCTITVNNNAKLQNYDTNTITATASYKFNGATKTASNTFVVTDPKYTFSFNGNGGTISPNAAITKYYYNAINANEIPSSGTRTGYEFIGMYKDARLNYAATKPTAGTTSGFTDNLKGGTPIESDTTWHAAWWAKNVNVRFVDNAGNDFAGNTFSYGKYDKTFSGSGLTAPAGPAFNRQSSTGTFDYVFDHWEVLDAKDINGNDIQGAYGTHIDNYVLKGDTVFQAKYKLIKSYYTVEILNEDGTQRAFGNNYSYRDTPATNGNPEKASDNYFDYTFKGWHRVADGEQRKGYVVNSDGLLSTSAVSDAADEGNKYIGYTNDLTVRSDATYVPVFEKKFIDYTVNFEYKDALGNTVTSEEKTYHYNDDLVLPEIPESYTTGGYRYPLVSWNSTDGKLPTKATESKKYVASYGEGIAAEYTLTFTYKDANGNDKTETREGVKHNSSVTAPNVPQTYRDAENEYTFSKWLDQDGAEFKSPAYKDAQYVAQYTAKKLYTVTFMNESEQFGETAKYVAGAKIVFPTVAPTKPADKSAWNYAFKNWVDADGNAVTVMPENDLVLEASYTPSYIEYAISFVWKNADGTDHTETKNYHYTDAVDIPDLEKLGASSYKDDTYSYVFKGWDTDVSKYCLGEGEMSEDGKSAALTYTATYRRSYNYYTVTWKQESATVSGAMQYTDYMTDAFIYNERVRIPTNAPKSVQKAPSGESYSMVLDHWAYKDADGNLVEIDRDTRITGNIEFYPVYKEAAKVCAVDFFDENGVALGRREIAYGTDLTTYAGIGAPKKSYTEGKHYEFIGWYGEDGNAVDVVTDDCKLYARYEEKDHTYVEIVADVLPTFFEVGHGTMTCTYCGKALSNQLIDEIPDTKEPTAKLFIKDQSYVSGGDVPAEALPVAPKNNLVIATDDKAEVSDYNKTGKGSGTGKIEYFVSESVVDFDAISDWKLRFDYDEYVAELEKQGLSESEIALAMSEFEANATAYVGDLANSYPEIVKDGNTFIFYAKITDRKGNVNYVRSQPLTLDATAPVITTEGHGNGGSKFCEEVTVKIHEDRKIVSLTVNGEEVAWDSVDDINDKGEVTGTLPTDTDRQLTLNGKGVYTVAVTDESGNVTEKTVEILGGHTEKETKIAPTCTEDGKTTYTCTVCGVVTKEADTIEKLGHDFKHVQTVKVTCTANGYDLYRCTRCGETKKENEVEATGKHTYGEWIVTKKATCSSTGSQYRVCEVCGESEVAEIAKDAAAHVWYRGVVTKPTCTDGGYTMHTCKYCGTTEKVEGSDVPALGHEAGAEWFIVKEASCEGYNEETKEGGTVGYKIHHCKRCDVEMNADLKTEEHPEYDTTTEIPVPGHSWKFEKTVPATSTEGGYTLYKCSACGAEKRTNETEKLVESTVTFYGENGTDVIGTVKRYKGETVLSNAVTEPTKAADKTYTYTFSHWALKDDDKNTAVKFPLTVGDSDIELKAVFAEKYINYTFIFYKQDEAGDYKQIKKVGYLHFDDAAKEFAGPANYEDEGATYEFAGWYPKDATEVRFEDIKDADGNVVAKANVLKEIKVSDVAFDEDNTAEFAAAFKKTVKKVNFTYAYDYDNIIYTAKFDYGTELDVNATIPADIKATVKKASDAAFHYTFSGWQIRDGAASVKPLKANGLAIAQFTATGHTLVHNDAKTDIPATCTTEGVSYKKCSVCGYETEEAISALGHDWGKEVEGKQHCTRCDATKDGDTRFVVKFFIEGETEALRTVSGIKYGESIVSRIPTPTKADEGSKTYTFEKWYKEGDETKTAVNLEEELKKITADATYVAAFTEKTRMVKVIYRVEGSTEALQVTEVEYGTKTIPEYTGVDPTTDKFDDYGHYVWYKAHPWSVEESDIPADGITSDLIINAQFVSEDHDLKATLMHNATCTEPMTEKFECTKCGYSYTKKTGKPLGHDFTDLVERVEPVGEKAGYEIYKCTRCDETETKVLAAKEYINFTVTVVDTKGNPVEGAKVSIFDGDTFVASNTTNAEGKVTFRVEKAKTYRVVIEGPDFDTIYGDITVNPDGSTSGDLPKPNIKACSCTCHRSGLWPSIFRFFHKIIKMLVGEFVCCGNPDSRYYK